jgi:long-chain acyl-CoA synthetase
LNLAECIALPAAVQPDKTAIIFADEHISFATLDRRSRQVASLLRRWGIGPGDRVGMVLPNVPQFAAVYYGILYAGAIAVPMNVLYRAREFAFQIDDAEMKAVIAHTMVAGEAAKALRERPQVKFACVEVGEEPVEPEAGESFLRLFHEADDQFDMVQTNPDDVAVIIYGAATDGRMRGAQLTHFNLFQNAQTIREYALGYYPTDVCITVLPLFHGFGQSTMMNAPLLAQSTIVLLPQFDPVSVAEAIHTHKATLLAAVPTMLHVLTHHRRAAEWDFSSLRVAISGGAALLPETGQAFTERFGIHVLEGYGLTETSPVVCWNPSVERNKPGSLGLPIWGVQMRIQREDGGWAEPGEVGEIVVRGHNVMKGYLNCPEVNADVMRDGWLHTGDLGRTDEDGYTWFMGLKKEMINRAGMNVYPKEVEAVLLEHPAVADAAVIGVPDAVRGEEVAALVVLAPGVEADPRDLAGYVREQIAAYKAPRKIHIVEHIPRKPDGRSDTAGIFGG